jgi:hypothetical protein
VEAEVGLLMCARCTHVAGVIRSGAAEREETMRLGRVVLPEDQDHRVQRAK